MTTILSWLGWGCLPLGVGYGSGVAHVQWIDNRHYKRGKTDDVKREAKLAEGRVNQFIGFKRHDFVAARDGEQAAA